MATHPRNVLVQLNAPERLGYVFEKVAFDVPRTLEGARFMGWWDSAARNQRDQVMKVAHEEAITVVAALSKLTESD